MREALRAPPRRQAPAFTAGRRLTRWEERPDGHRLTTAGGTLKARQVIVATNGYTPEDVSPRHAGRIMPALSSIIVTRPLTETSARHRAGPRT